MSSFLYGIPNCDTVRKARAWLEQAQIPYTFYDVRTQGLSADLIHPWIALFGWQALVNKRSTTWRQLTEAQKTHLNEQTLIPLLIEHPTLLKRPLYQDAQGGLLGFQSQQWQTYFTASAK